MIFKLVGSEVTVNSTPTTVSNARVLRILNDTGGLETITVRDTSNNVIGSISIESKVDIVLEKNKDHTVESDADALVTPLAYTIS